MYMYSRCFIDPFSHSWLHNIICLTKAVIHIGGRERTPANESHKASLQWQGKGC